MTAGGYDPVWWPWPLSHGACRWSQAISSTSSTYNHASYPQDNRKPPERPRLYRKPNHMTRLQLLWCRSLQPRVTSSCLSCRRVVPVVSSWECSQPGLATYYTTGGRSSWLPRDYARGFFRWESPPERVTRPGFGLLCVTAVAHWGHNRQGIRQVWCWGIPRRHTRRCLFLLTSDGSPLHPSHRLGVFLRTQAFAVKHCCS
jgi:hypothetical protein